MILAGAGVAAVIAGAALVWLAGGDEQTPLQEFANEDPGPIHVHGLGVNPADGALFIATHTGLYRVADDEQEAARVGDRYQDTMGFTVIGPNRFLGSGHPDLNEAREKGLPPHLGLIESNDSGESWQPISLQGEADFHVLRFAGQRVYGYDASNDRLLASSDRGRSWSELAKPGPLVDLAVARGAPETIIAASSGGLQDGLFESGDGGETWRRVRKAVGLLAWPKPKRLYIVVTGGQVFRSNNGGRTLDHRGEIGGQPAAFLAAGPDELYAALHDGTIKRSVDGGATWSVRSAP
jgi:photosystem II stability/assembly factor-like uncharacterized protein